MHQVIIAVIALFLMAVNTYIYVKKYFFSEKRNASTFKYTMLFAIFSSIILSIGLTNAITLVIYQADVPLYIQIFVIAIYILLSISVSFIAAFISEKKYKT